MQFLTGGNALNSTRELNVQQVERATDRHTLLSHCTYVGGARVGYDVLRPPNYECAVMCVICTSMP